MNRVLVKKGTRLSLPDIFNRIQDFSRDNLKNKSDAAVRTYGVVAYGNDVDGYDRNLQVTIEGNDLIIRPGIAITPNFNFIRVTQNITIDSGLYPTTAPQDVYIRYTTEATGESVPVQDGFYYEGESSDITSQLEEVGSYEIILVNTGAAAPSNSLLLARAFFFNSLPTSVTDRRHLNLYRPRFFHAGPIWHQGWRSWDGHTPTLGIHPTIMPTHPSDNADAAWRAPALRLRSWHKDASAKPSIIFSNNNGARFQGEGMSVGVPMRYSFYQNRTTDGPTGSVILHLYGRRPRDENNMSKPDWIWRNWVQIKKEEELANIRYRTVIEENWGHIVLRTRSVNEYPVGYRFRGVGINMNVPGSSLQINGNLAVGFGNAPVVAPTDGMVVNGAAGFGFTSVEANQVDPAVAAHFKKVIRLDAGIDDDPTINETVAAYVQVKFGEDIGWIPIYTADGESPEPPEPSDEDTFNPSTLPTITKWELDPGGIGSGRLEWNSGYTEYETQVQFSFNFGAFGQTQFHAAGTVGGTWSPSGSEGDTIRARLRHYNQNNPNWESQGLYTDWVVSDVIIVPEGEGIQ